MKTNTQIQWQLMLSSCFWLILVYTMYIAHTQREKQIKSECVWAREGQNSKVLGTIKINIGYLHLFLPLSFSHIKCVLLSGYLNLVYTIFTYTHTRSLSLFLSFVQKHMLDFHPLNCDRKNHAVERRREKNNILRYFWYAQRISKPIELIHAPTNFQYVWRFYDKFRSVNVSMKR